VSVEKDETSLFEAIKGISICHALAKEDWLVASSQSLFLAIHRDPNPSGLAGLT